MPQLKLTPMRAAAANNLAVESNNKIRYSFVTGYNNITKKKGWRPTDIPGFDPVPPVMVVHDILEHFPGDEYDPHNEYQAQGAMFWLRHEGGFDFREDTSKAVIRPAFGMLFSHIVHKSLSTNPCPAVKEAHKPLENLTTENEMQRTLLNAREYALGVGDYGREGMSYPEKVGKAKGKKLLLESLEQAIGWMRIGYRRAAIRYKGLDKRKLVSLYENIVDLFDNIEDLRKETNIGASTAMDLTIDYRRYEATASIAFTVKGNRRN